MTLSIATSELAPRLSEPSRSVLPKLVTDWGGPVSNALFDPETKVFAVPGINGVVGYRTTLGCAVAIGDPVCPLESRDALALAFRAHCHAQGWHVVYAVASDAFATWCRSIGAATVEFGREHVMDPARNPLAGSASQRLRGKVRRAERDRVLAREYRRARGIDSEVERAMEDVVAAWQDARRGPQIYMAPVRLFAGAEVRRWFYALREGRVIGVLMATRLERFGGYVFNQLLQTPDAPPGTTELLAVFALETFGTEGCRYASFGPMACADIGIVSGLRPWSERFARWMLRTSAETFHLTRREMYRRKFPIVATPAVHLVFDPPHLGMREAFALMRAFHATTSAV